MKYILLIGMMFCVLFASAQVTQDSVRVYFRQGQSVIDVSYRENAAHFTLLKERYLLYSRYPQYWLKGIRIVSSASPEATFSFNERLSKLRAESILNYLKSHSVLDSSLLQIHSLGEDWKTLRRIVNETPDVPHREEVLEALERHPDGQEGEDDLKRIAGGEAYRYLYNKVYPRLRQTNVVFDVVKEHNYSYPNRSSLSEFMPEMNLQIAQEERVALKKDYDTFTVVEPYDVWTVKTNLLYDALLSPSVEVEYRFAPRWSAHVDYAIAWWSKKSKHKYYQLMQLSPEMRYWFNPMKYWKGHYVGAFVGAGYYDLENGKRGYKGEYLMAGFSYGYMFPIGRNLSLDAGIGVGYLNTKYEEYLPFEGHYVYQQTSRTGYVGPVKARLSLVWHVGRVLAKGGKR